MFSCTLCTLWANGTWVHEVHETYAQQGPHAKERTYYMNEKFIYEKPRYFQRPSKHSKPIAKICTPKETAEAQRMWDALCRASKKKMEDNSNDEK